MVATWMTMPSRSYIVSHSTGRPRVGLAQSQTSAADESDTRNLTGRAKLGDEFAQTGDQVIVIEGSHGQTLAKVSRQARTPRLANSAGTSECGGTGSAGSTSSVRGSRESAPVRRPGWRRDPLFTEAPCHKRCDRSVPHCAREEVVIELQQLIGNAFDAGADTICELLAGEGTTLSRTTVWRILTAEGRS